MLAEAVLSRPKSPSAARSDAVARVPDADASTSRRLRRRSKRDALRATSPIATDSAVVTSAGYGSDESEEAEDAPLDALDLLIERSRDALAAARSCLSTTIDSREALRRLNALDDTLDRSISRYEEQMRSSVAGSSHSTPLELGDDASGRPMTPEAQAHARKPSLISGLSSGAGRRASMYGRPSALETHVEDDALDLSPAVQSTTAAEAGPAALPSVASTAPSSWMGALFSPAVAAADTTSLRSPSDARGLLAALAARPSPSSQSQATPSRSPSAPTTPARHARTRYSPSAMLSPAPSLPTSGVTVSPSATSTDESRASPALARSSLDPFRASVIKMTSAESAAAQSVPAVEESGGAGAMASPRPRSHMRRQSSVDLPTGPTTPLHDRVHAVRETRTSAADASAADRLRMALRR